VEETIVAIVIGFVIAGYELWTRIRLKRLRKHVLRELLGSSDYEWRSLQRLSHSIALDEQSTKDLLIEVHVTPDANGKDLWKLD
jgi:hypothetical protein